MPRLAAILLFLATLAFAAAPLITPPFTGYDPASFPVRIERPAIQPAGYAFSIWILIYGWLILHAAYGLWKREQHPAWQVVRVPLCIAVLVGVVWLAIAAQGAIRGTITIWLMAGAAILAFLRADPAIDRWLLSAPTAVFAGWLSAAAAVSTGVVIAGYGWLTDTQTAAAMLALVLTLAVTVQRQRPEMPAYGVTVIWALLGVVAANGSENLTVSVLATAGIALMVVTLLALRRG